MSHLSLPNPFTQNRKHPSAAGDDRLVIDQRSAFAPHLAMAPTQIGIDALAIDMTLQDLQSHQVGRTEFGIVEVHPPQPIDQILDRLPQIYDRPVIRRKATIEPEIDAVR